MRAIVGVDVGGTFTDVAVIAGGRLVTAKVPTTPSDHALGVIEGVRLALAEAGLAAADVAHFGHGTTVATNAMLERRGARTAFVGTRGFADIPALGRQARPHLYRPEVAPPADAENEEGGAAVGSSMRAVAPPVQSFAMGRRR